MNTKDVEIKISKISIFVGISIFLLSFTCAPTYEEIEVVYKDENGRSITTIYHNPANGEGIYSVTLKNSDGQWITLNQTIAASGARYTDNKTLVWWAKGDGAFMMNPDGKGDWEITGTFKEVITQENR
ncbi:MliC family protein [Leptospira sp. 96542]|nr:MliC family protein [Leptospira sp. 96542]